MKYGINTVLWTWPFTSNDLYLLEKIKKYGYDSVEIAVEDFSDKNVNAIRNALEDNSLNCIICGAFSPERSIISSNKKTQQAGMDYLKQLIDLAVSFSSTMIVGPTYSVGINPELVKPEKKKNAWNNCVSNLKEISSYAEASNVNIAVEPLNRYETNFITTAQEAIDLIKEVGSNNIGVQLDIYHMNIEEKDPAESIRKTGNHLFHLHVPEHDRGTPGTGHTDWKRIAKALKQINFEKAVVIESCDPAVEPIVVPGAIWRTYDYKQDILAEKGLQYIKKVMK